MTRIVWFSRHQPTERQRTELESIFGADVALEHDSRAFDGADDIVTRFKLSGASELIVVAPDAVIRAIVRRGIRPLHARMELCSRRNPEREVTIDSRYGKPRHYRHVCFERITHADFQTEPLTSLV